MKNKTIQKIVKKCKEYIHKIYYKSKRIIKKLKNICYRFYQPPGVKITVSHIYKYKYEQIYYQCMCSKKLGVKIMFHRVSHTNICITYLGWIKGVYFFSFFLSLFIFGITECLHEVIPNINRERKKEKKSNTLYPPEVCLALNIPTLK